MSKTNDREKSARLQPLRASLLLGMVTAATMLLACLTVPLLADIDETQRLYLLHAGLAALGLYVLEYGVLLWTSQNKTDRIKGNLLDIGVITLPALSWVMPASGPSTAITVTAAVLIVLDGAVHLRRLSMQRPVGYVLAGTLLPVIILGLLAYHFEQAAHNAAFTSWQSIALWLPSAGMDAEPITAAGRALVGMTALFGIACVGFAWKLGIDFLIAEQNKDQATQPDELTRLAAMIAANLAPPLARIEETAKQTLAAVNSLATHR